MVARGLVPCAVAVCLVALVSAWTFTPRFGPSHICPTSPSGTLEDDGMVQFAVSVTPKGSTVTQPANTNGLTSYFTVKNTGTCADTFNVTASRDGRITVVSVSPSSIPNLQPGASQQVAVTYSAGASGAGTLILTAIGGAGGESDNGNYNVTVQAQYSVAVTPDGAMSTTRAANGTYTDTFTVQNTGYYTDTYNAITCSGYVNVTCTSATPGSFLLGSGASQKVAASYTVAGAGTGRLGLTVASTNANDGAWYRVPVTAVPGAPLVDQTPYNYPNQEYGRCAVACFATVYIQSTVPYFSFDTPRSVTLAYNSDRVNPRPFVHVNVTPDLSYGQTPTEYRLQVKVKWDGVSPTLVTFLNGDSTLRFTYPGSAPVRLGAQFDASAYATKVYPMDILVSAYYAGTNTLLTNDIATKLVVVNETSSPIAAGWTIAGAARLYLQSDSAALITEGDGSAVYFTRVAGAYVSPGGEFSKLVLSNLSGTNGWARVFPDSSKTVFDNTGRTVQVRDRFNNFTTLAYDGSGRLVKVTDPANLADTLTYGPNGLASIRDPGSPPRTTTVTVDASRKLTAIADPDSVSTRFVFDTNLELTKTIDRRGDTTAFAYHTASRKLTTITYPPVPVFGVGTVSLTETRAGWQLVGVPYTSTGITAAPAPLADTVRARTTDARGFATVLQVDRLGVVTRTVDALGRSASFTLDTNSHVVRDSTPTGHIVRRAWSGSHPTQLWDSTTGRVITFAYDPIWNQLSQVVGDADSLWSYWSSGHMDSTVSGTRATSSPLRRLTKFTYDAFGRPVTITDPLNHADTTFYDATIWRNRDSTRAGGRRTARRYDGYGRVIATKTPRGDSTITLHDLLNRQTTVIGPVGDTTIFTYDSLSLRQVRDAIRQTYQFGLNAAGWLVNRTDPTGRQDQYQYDQNGNPRQVTNRRGQVLSFGPYDALNRLTALTADGKTTKFAYDPQGRFVVDSNAESIDTVKVDVAGRVQSQISIRAGTRYELASHYSWLDLQDTLRSTSPWADTIAYHYNASFALDTLRDVAGGRTVLAYDRHLLDTLVTLPNGLTITGQYPSVHHTAQVTYNFGVVAAAIGAKYDYDSLGLVTDRHNLASNDTIINTGRDYSADPLGRLTRYGDYTQGAPQHCEPYDPNTGWVCWGTGKSYSAQEVYTYDKVGNRKVVAGDTVALGNRLVRFNGDSLVYDFDGNLTARIHSGAPTQLLYWSSLGRLDSVWTSGVGTVTFGYDGAGRRVRKTGASTTVRYVYDGDNLFAEVDGAAPTTPLAEYTSYPGIDAPHSVRRRMRSDSVFYYAQNFPGNVVALINGAQSLVAQYKYKPYGGDDGSSPSSMPNSFRFAARQLDTETGLYYMRARYYDPGLGRFISEDPIGLAGGINPYTYAAGNPVNYRDPTGQEACSDNGGGGAWAGPPPGLRYTAPAPGASLSGDPFPDCTADGTGGSSGGSFRSVADVWSFYIWAMAQPSGLVMSEEWIAAGRPKPYWQGWYKNWDPNKPPPSLAPVTVPVGNEQHFEPGFWVFDKFVRETSKVRFEENLPGVNLADMGLSPVAEYSGYFVSISGYVHGAGIAYRFKAKAYVYSNGYAQFQADPDQCDCP